MSLADAAPIIAGLGGVSGIGAAFRWLLDRAELACGGEVCSTLRLVAREVFLADALGAALTANAAAQDRLADAVESLVPRVVRIDERIGSIDLTGEFRRAQGTS